MTARPRFGLFLNLGATIADSPEAVMQLTIEQAELAERLGFHDVWVTEHHFIPFGINPSALTTAAFLLGRTSRIHVGTAVVLAPLQHPIALAEHAALLDQISGGRFELGIGRGGYLKDYEVLEVDTERWAEEPLRSTRQILDSWADRDLEQPDHTTGATILQPSPRSAHPPLLLATRSAETIEFAAKHRIPLQHYFAVPTKDRVRLELTYAEAAPDQPAVDHLHTVIAVVADDAGAARQQLTDRLVESFTGGDWPHVPGAGSGHARPDGTRPDRQTMARGVAEQAMIGTVDEIGDQLRTFCDQTNARRVAFYAEAIGDPDATRATIVGLATLIEAPG